MKRPVIVPVGGFLGAGKTTLIRAAARVLAGRGLRCAAILNDQAGGLVDTEASRAHGLAADQVTGGCFCCRLTDLLEAAARLAAHSPDVIFAEPVGSCTDLAATVIRPLLRDHCDRFDIAPLTVLVDPGFALQASDPDAAYLFGSQIEEADILCFSKSDAFDTFPDLPALRLSALTGEGLEAWLGLVLSDAVTPAGKSLTIDYQRYAEAEAALAWLNLQASIELASPLPPAMLAGPLLDELDAALTAAGARIAHLKLFDRCGAGWVKASLCANGAEPGVEGTLDASPASRHELLLNLRAVADPGRLGEISRECLNRLPGALRIGAFECFRPAPPKPECRVS